MPADREWRNSWFGRIVGTCFGLISVGIVLFVSPEDGSPKTSPTNFLIASGIVLVGLLVATAVWTSKLKLEGGTLTATNFGRSASVLIVDLEVAEPSFPPGTGLIVRTIDDRKVRTLISGRFWDEPWKTRAERICEELEHHARMARE